MKYFEAFDFQLKEEPNYRLLKYAALLIIESITDEQS